MAVGDIIFGYLIDRWNVEALRCIHSITLGTVKPRRHELFYKN